MINDIYQKNKSPTKEDNQASFDDDVYKTLQDEEERVELDIPDDYPEDGIYKTLKNNKSPEK